jgi:hypothetical protein
VDDWEVLIYVFLPMLYLTNLIYYDHAALSGKLIACNKLDLEKSRDWPNIKYGDRSKCKLTWH